MRVLFSRMLLLSCVVGSIGLAAPPAKKTDNLKPGYVYQLDTGDVVAIYSTDPKTGSHNCLLHVVQTDGTLHLPFGKVKARGMTIAEIRDSMKPLSEDAKQHGLVNVTATIVDLRTSVNDHILQNLR
jgi:protein involved in polysaccharide export with SLBB domain